MTQASLHYVAFLDEILTSRLVYTIQDAQGIPCPLGDAGKRAMPFWSSSSRASNIIEKVPAYRGMTIRRLDFSEFTDKWLPGLAKDGLNVGCNWSGNRAMGYDVDPVTLLAALKSVAASHRKKS